MMRWLGYICITLLIALAAGFIWYLAQVARPIHLNQTITVEIPENSGTEGAISALYDVGIVRSRTALWVHVLLTGRRTELRSGTYTFSGDVTLPMVLNIITKQQSFQGEVEMTLLEGWTAEQMGEALSPNFSFSMEDYVAVTEAPTNFTQDWLDEARSLGTLQGFLFPDTYRFFVDASASDVIAAQLDTFDQRFTQQMHTDLAASGRSLYDAVILASIVQKEANTPEDMKLVAGVFLKRLAANMPLQSDVTIEYITQKQGVRPTYSDLDLESAYNTYRNTGLPPTPISNPGLDALTAVVYPVESDYWYFIATPEGEVLYSETYEQHLQYKNQYYP